MTAAQVVTSRPHSCLMQSPTVFLFSISGAQYRRPAQESMSLLDSGQRGQTSLGFTKLARFAVESCCTDLRAQDGNSLLQRSYHMSLASLKTS